MKISLISRWKLRNGCPQELIDTLKTLAGTVKENEPGTLAYSVHLQINPPLDDQGQPIECNPPIPLKDQTEVTFFEIYASAQAFSDHVNGPTFEAFVQENIKHFLEDPHKPGSPDTITIFLEEESAFFS